MNAEHSRTICISAQLIKKEKGKKDVEHQNKKQCPLKFWEINNGIIFVLRAMKKIGPAGKWVLALVPISL